MDKKGLETQMLKTIGGLIIGVLVVVALISIIYIIIPKSSNEGAEVPIFYYKTLVNKISELNVNEVKEFPFFSTEDYALVGFGKSLNEVSSLNEACGKMDLDGVIIKPSSCNGNACLCICEIESGLISLGGDLIVKCYTEKSLCKEFREDVVGGLICNYYLYYDATEKIKNLEVTRTPDKITIKTK